MSILWNEKKGPVSPGECLDVSGEKEPPKDDEIEVEVEDEDEKDEEIEDEPNAVPVVPRRYVNESDRK